MPPGSIASKVKDYDGAHESEFLIWAYHCKSVLNLLEIFKVSESLNDILPNVNKMLRLFCTAPVCTTPNKRAFGKPKIVKHHLKSINRLRNWMGLNSNEDILDNIVIEILVENEHF